MRFNWLYLQTPLPTRPVRADDSSMLSLDSSFSRDGMNSNWIGSFGEQWFGTMCIASRCIHSKPNQDTAGFDFLVTDQQSETIRVQVKATEQPQWRDGSLAFDLDVATYDKLRQGTTPGFLVVVGRPTAGIGGLGYRGSGTQSSIGPSDEGNASGGGDVHVLSRFHSTS